MNLKNELEAIVEIDSNHNALPIGPKDRLTIGANRF